MILKISEDDSCGGRCHRRRSLQKEKGKREKEKDEEERMVWKQKEKIKLEKKEEVRDKGELMTANERVTHVFGLYIDKIH